jgi:hypothetical protein
MNFEFKTNTKENPEYRKRIESWDEMERYLDESTSDEYDDFEEFSEGSIEEGIKELVVGLNLIGIETTGSCEGHFKGVSRTNGILYIDELGKEYYEKIENPPLEGVWSNPHVAFPLDVYPFLASTEKERILASTEKERKIKEEEKERKIITALQSLIDEYYQEKKEMLEVRVRIKKARSRYADYEITASNAEGTEKISGIEDYRKLKQKATERLKSEQQEILGFSKFIKKKYLETGFHL